MGRLADHVRASCAQIAADARSVRIDHDRLAAYDPAPTAAAGATRAWIRSRHYLEGTPADVAMYTLALDTINFGSGWFPTLRKRVDPATADGLGLLHRRLEPRRPLPRARAWTNAQLRAMRTEQLAGILGQRADHELMPVRQALRELARFLGDRTPGRRRRGGGSADRLAATLAGRWPSTTTAASTSARRSSPTTSRWPASRPSTTSTG